MMIDDDDSSYLIDDDYDYDDRQKVIKIDRYIDRQIH